MQLPRMRCQVARSGAPERSHALNSLTMYTGRRVPSRTGSGVRPLAESLYHCARDIPQMVQGRAVARGRGGSMGVDGVVMPAVSRAGHPPRRWRTVRYPALLAAVACRVVVSAAGGLVLDVVVLELRDDVPLESADCDRDSLLGQAADDFLARQAPALLSANNGEGVFSSALQFSRWFFAARGLRLQQVRGLFQRHAVFVPSTLDAQPGVQLSEQLLVERLREQLQLIVVVAEQAAAKDHYAIHVACVGLVQKAAKVVKAVVEISLIRE